MVAEGDKVAARFIMRGAYRSTGGDRIPAPPLLLNPGGQTFEISGTGLVRASFLAGNTNTTVVLLWAVWNAPWAADATPFYDVGLLAHAHP